MFYQHLDDLGPAPRGRLVERCVTGIITPIDLPDILLQTVQNHILQGGGGGEEGRGGGVKVKQTWRLVFRSSSAHANDDKCKRADT